MYKFWGALKNVGVKMWDVRVIQGMYTDVRSRVRGVWGSSLCVSGTLAFHTCAESSVTAVPYLCAVGAFVCRRPCSNGRLSRRMHCKVEGMERGM